MLNTHACPFGDAGMLSHCLLVRRLETLFTTLDADHDGVLTREELLQGLSETTMKRRAAGETELTHGASMPELATLRADSSRQGGINAKASAQWRRP